jgi:ribosomal protein S18 acetylase RimI-like enzyme
MSGVVASDLNRPFVVRRLAEVDLVDYKQLREQMLGAHPEAFSSDASEARSRAPESYRSRLGLDRPEGGEFTLGAWIDGVMVGAISCERESRIKVRHIGHIIGMMVRETAQGQGIGRALLDDCIAEARRASGLQMLVLQVTADNRSATQLYEKAGFVRYGQLPRAICVDGVYYAKDQMVLTL